MRWSFARLVLGLREPCSLGSSAVLTHWLVIGMTSSSEAVPVLNFLFRLHVPSKLGLRWRTVSFLPLSVDTTRPEFTGTTGKILFVIVVGNASGGATSCCIHPYRNRNLTSSASTRALL